MKSISKYHQRYAEPEAELILDAIRRKKLNPWDYFIGIPLCGEHQQIEDLLENIESLKFVVPSDRGLCLIVINEGPDVLKSYQASNRQTIEKLKSSTIVPLTNEPPSWLLPGKAFDFLIINRCGDWQFPLKQGVGLARKIVGDIGTALFEEQFLKRQWIHNTDADARLPKNYFLQAEEIQEASQIKALIYQYAHQPPKIINDHGFRHWRAAQWYEVWLRYYELGLQFAGSPYAFPTIGSIITFAASAYVEIRGFPKRNAGEDFYLLNKLAKVGKVHILGGDPVSLIDRPSERVPFGTGQGTYKISLLQEKQKEYLVYHPNVFLALKAVLDFAYYWLSTIRSSEQKQLKREDLITFFRAYPNLLENLDSLAKFIDLFEEFGFLEILRLAPRQSRDFNGAIRQFHTWFDAFRTLKWIHLIRDHFLGSLDLFDALQQSNFFKIPQFSSVDDLLNQIRLQQRVPKDRGLYRTLSITPL